MTAAEQNDSLRRAILSRHFFGSSSPASGSLAFAGAVWSLTPAERQQLMEAIPNCESFDNPEHTAATFAWGDYAASYTASFRLDGKCLIVGID
jgi:hypothetical protein